MLARPSYIRKPERPQELHDSHNTLLGGRFGRTNGMHCGSLNEDASPIPTSSLCTIFMCIYIISCTVYSSKLYIYHIYICNYKYVEAMIILYYITIRYNMNRYSI